MEAKKRNKIFLIGWTILITTLSLVNLNGLKKVSVADGDKYVHLIFYFVLTFFLFINIELDKNNKSKKLLLSSAIAISYGIVIEVIQGAFTTTREFDCFDILANTTGSLSAVVFLIFFSKKVKF